MVENTNDPIKKEDIKEIKKDELKEFRQLYPFYPYKLVDGNMVNVKPIQNKYRVAFSELLVGIFRKFQEKNIELDNITNMKIIVENCYEEVLKFLQLYFEKDSKWIDELWINDTIEILDILLEQNITESLKKTIKKLKARMT